MRILTGIDLPFLPTCGSLILCDDLYYFKTHKHQVRFLALRSENSPKWSKLPDVHLLNIEKVYDEHDYENYVFALKEKIWEHVVDFRPDIIHIQHLGFGMSLAFLEINTVPKLALCHGTDILFSLQDDFHRDNLIRIINNVNFIVFPTNNMLYKLLSFTSINTDYGVIPWGVPDWLTVEGKPRVWTKPGKKILYAGRLSKEKNVQVLIKAMKYIEDINLTIIGKGDQKDELINISKQLKLKDRVEFEDFIPREVLWRRFYDFDAIVIPTKDVEAFCLLAVEAQLHGLPIIHSNTVGLEEVVGKTGIIFCDHENAKDLAHKINILLSDPDLLTSISYAGYHNAKKYRISRTRKLLIKASEKSTRDYQTE